MEEARQIVALADKVLVVGTSLTMYPAAGWVEFARVDAERVVNALQLDEIRRGSGSCRANPPSCPSGHRLDVRSCP